MARRKRLITKWKIASAVTGRFAPCDHPRRNRTRPRGACVVAAARSPNIARCGLLDDIEERLRDLAGPPLRKASHLAGDQIDVWANDFAKAKRALRRLSPSRQKGRLVSSPDKSRVAGSRPAARARMEGYEGTVEPDGARRPAERTSHSKVRWPRIKGKLRRERPCAGAPTSVPRPAGYRPKNSFQRLEVRQQIRELLGFEALRQAGA
jgi:hypothetical protein